tara:strand:- start:79242 stop:79940 length:699 start_codon:yes stop_codon:yes gene_type:complete
MSDPKVQANNIEGQLPFDIVRSLIQNKKEEYNRESEIIELIAVSKTVQADRICPLLEKGHKNFGENRVQEATLKWPPLREKWDDIVLHLIGPLQTNKVQEAVRVFDVIHSLDRKKLAASLAREFDKSDRQLPCFIQVNIGEEDQKSGIRATEVDEFVRTCQIEYALPIVGLMCIPPADEDATPYFALLQKIAKDNGLKQLSMGMSADYETAIQFGATHVRIGSAIFGPRITN